MVGRLLVLWASLLHLFSGSHSFVLDSSGGGTMSSDIKRFYPIGKSESPIKYDVRNLQFVMSSTSPS